MRIFRASPLSGSGQLLDRMLAAIGLSRPASHRLHYNVISGARPATARRPSGNADVPALFLRAIEVCRPRFILCLGATPTQRLTGRTEAS